MLTSCWSPGAAAPGLAGTPAQGHSTRLQKTKWKHAGISNWSFLTRLSHYPNCRWRPFPIPHHVYFRTGNICKQVRKLQWLKHSIFNKTLFSHQTFRSGSCIRITNCVCVQWGLIEMQSWSVSATQGTFIHISVLLSTSDAQCTVQHVVECRMYKYFTVGLSQRFFTARLMETFSHWPVQRATYSGINRLVWSPWWRHRRCLGVNSSNYGTQTAVFHLPNRQKERKDLSKTLTLLQRINRPSWTWSSSFAFSTIGTYFPHATCIKQSRTER